MSSVRNSRGFSQTFLSNITKNTYLSELTFKQLINSKLIELIPYYKDI